MAAEGIDDYVIPSTDEHLNEYLPLWRRRREFLSGFTGSAGDLLVGLKDAWLYADGRYHLQAAQELEGSGISLMKVGLPAARTLPADLEERAKARAGLVVGIDPMIVPLSFAETLPERLAQHDATLREIPRNLVDPLWTDRPEPSTSPLMLLPAEWVGADPAQKIDLIREDVKKAGAEALAVIKLDQIAWLFNLRSRDEVPYNPVFESFLFLERDAVHLFLRGARSRLPAGFWEAVPGLRVHDYEDFPHFLTGVKGRVSIDPSGITQGVASALRSAGCTLIKMPSPIEDRKSVKNAAEQAAQKRANLLASAAKTRALLWLRRSVATGQTVTEEGFRQKIESLYAEQPGFFGLSFNTIAATGPHGAIVHYGECDATPLLPGHLFLIDSGAHISGGTTDDTRTVAVGAPEPEARRLYTLVLKGHIAAARQTIPEGAAGTALDALARSPLWNETLTYDHGTGHGVGAFLNVHEGPFALSERERKPFAAQPLKEGIISSIEPGCYREGHGGIRLENLYLYVKAGEPKSGRTWLRLEPLTWIPFDPVLIDPSLLDPAERAWLEAYHRECLAKLSPLLSEEEHEALRVMLSAAGTVPRP
jgi:Xaa-Pro aminopeptidase